MGGIFKFIVEFPSAYPNERPTVSFVTPVYHPLVDPRFNKLNLDLEFGEWVPGKHWAINVLLFIKKLFHMEYMFKLVESPDAVMN